MWIYFVQIKASCAPIPEDEEFGESDDDDESEEDSPVKQVWKFY